MIFLAEQLLSMPIDAIICRDIWHEIIAFLRPFDLLELSRASPEFDGIIDKLVPCKYVFMDKPHKKYTEIICGDLVIKTTKDLYVIRDNFVIDTGTMQQHQCRISGSGYRHKYDEDTIFEIDMTKKLLVIGRRDYYRSAGYHIYSATNFEVLLDNRKLIV